MDILSLDLALPLRSFELRVDLRVAGETLAVVGPSGAGKSSLLRAVAGLAEPARGRLTLGDAVWFDGSEGICLRPEERSVGYLFQSYALFPHLSVADNVAFGGRGRASELLERFGIAHLARQRPDTLSGGERQRAALARALAREPQVLLLDEPLSALDAQTRSEVRAELATLLKELGLPTILVTHDFEDAATLGDRVAALVEGEVRQQGRAADLVAAPSDPFVARVAGANVLAGTASPGPLGLTTFATDTGARLLSTDPGLGSCSAAVYPADIALSSEPPLHDSRQNTITATVAGVVPVGNRVRVRMGPLVAEITAASARRLRVSEGATMVASFKASSTRIIGSGRR